MLGNLRVYAQDGSFYCAEFGGMLLAVRLDLFTGDYPRDSLRHIGNIAGNHFRSIKSEARIVNSPHDGCLDARCLNDEELAILSKAL